MKKTVIVYGEARTGVQKKALALLSRFLLEFTGEYPACFTAPLQGEEYRCIYIGTLQTNPCVAAAGHQLPMTPEGYAITVQNDTVYIEGIDDVGVLYGCVDFYNEYLSQQEFTCDDRYLRDPLARPFPDFHLASAPAVKERGLWTWGHVIYDYKAYMDNMVLLKMNTLILWNDHVPVNAADMVAYAHSCGIRLVWGYAWGWDTACGAFSFEDKDKIADAIVDTYEREYAPVGGDGVYFQSFTELAEETIGDRLIADEVVRFVNGVAARLYEKHPDMILQFGLHAASVRNRLEYIARTDPRIRIVWENCGAFPFAHQIVDAAACEETAAFVRKIAVLRGAQDRFGAVTKGLTGLDWDAFTHLPGSQYLDRVSDRFLEGRIRRKRKIWRYLQAVWLRHADKAQRTIALMAQAKEGDLCLTALVEDGVFERQVMYPVALYGELLWDPCRDLDDLANAVALRDYVTFA